MSELNGALSLILLLIAAMQPTEERRFVALIYASFCIAHYVFMYDADGFAYYGTAALCDLLVIIFTARLHVISQVIRDIHNICIVSIVLNAVGWVMWMAYMPPYAYNASFLALYVVAVITLMKLERRDGEHTLGARHNNVLADSSKSDH